MGNSMVYVINGYMTVTEGDGILSNYHALIGVADTPWDALKIVKPYFGCAIDKALEELMDAGETYGGWLNPHIGDKEGVAGTIVITEAMVMTSA